MLIKIRKSFFSKVVAVFTLLSLITNLLSPLSVYALTSGPSQPEVQSFTPIGTTDMVDLFSGDFNYNIPLLDVEGYPINIAYQSGPTMDQEASWVGLGWNLNVGNINRNLRGLPDDFKGDAIIKEQTIKPNRSYGVTVTAGVSPEIFGSESGDHLANLDLSIGYGLKYNNYSGVAVEKIFNIAISAGEDVKIPGTLGLGIKSSSDQGLDISPSYSITAGLAYLDKINTSIGASLTTSLMINSREGLKQVALNPSINTQTTSTFEYKDASGKTKGLETEHKESPLSTNLSFVPTGLRSYTPSSSMPMHNLSITLSGKLGGTIYGVDAFAEIQGYYSEQKLATKISQNAAYGYLYSEFANTTSSLHDVNREKEASFTPNQRYLPIPQHTYDTYIINGQGIGGMFRPHRSDYGSVYDPTVSSTSESNSLGIEISGGALIKGGANLTIVNTNSTSGIWSDENNAYSLLKFKGKTNSSNYEPYYFKLAGEKSVNDDVNHFNKIKNFDAVRVKLNRIPQSTVLASGELAFNPTTSIHLNSINKRTIRDKRNQIITTLTIDEAKKYGIDKKLYNQISGKAKGHHIGEITTIKDDGIRYIYGLPAYNNYQKDATFNVSGQHFDCSSGLVNYSGTDNSISNERGENRYYSANITPAYAHNYFLTSILSPDYYDFDNIAGPSDDDLGSYTLFKYKLHTDNYKWRIPFQANKANYNEALKALKTDNQGSYIYGEKELWYIDTIITKNNVAIFYKSIRDDAYGVNGENGGNTSWLPSSSSLKLDSIVLYSKQDLYKNLSSAIPIKKVHFRYDYSLCPNVPNNRFGGGKLTLKELYFSYGNSHKAKFSKYNFNYSNENPSYNLKSYDRWGGYQANSCSGSGTQQIGTMDFPYTKQNDYAASLNAANAWQLKSIDLPSGATINIRFEPDDYAYVQDKRALQMCKIIGFSAGQDKNNVSTELMYGGENQHVNQYMIVELPEPIPMQQNIVDEIRKRYIPGNTNLFFKALVKMSPGNGDAYEYISGYLDLLQSSNFFGPAENGVVTINNQEFLKYIWLQVKTVPIGDRKYSPEVHPISKVSWNFGKRNLPRLIWENEDPSDSGVEEVLKALVNSSFFKNIKEFIQGPNRTLRNKGVGVKVSNNVDCYIRLKNPNGKKLGGGSRVKYLWLNDNWAMSSGSSISGQEYNYTLEDPLNNRVISSGVASYEPFVGGEENPLRQPVYIKEELKMVPDDEYFQETPLGESFFPPAAVGYSRVTVKNIVSKYDSNGNLLPVDDQSSNVAKQSPSNGYSVHEFYTAKDFPVISKATDLDSKPLKPVPINTLMNTSVKDYMTVSQGYVIEINDMHGKPKAVWNFSENQKSAISGTEFKYKNLMGKLDNNIRVVNKSGISQTKMVGVDVDFVTDFRQSKTQINSSSTGINVTTFLIGVFPIIIPTCFPKSSFEETRFRSAVCNKIITRYGIQNETITYNEGAVVKTEILALDAETGASLITKTTNSYNDPVYSLSKPAHWINAGMGQAYKNINFTAEINFTNGSGTISSNESDYFFPGDELSLNSGEKVWVLSKTNNSIKIIDKSGNNTTINGQKTVKVIRSGYRNQQGIPLSTISCQVDPSNSIASNSYSKVIASQAVEYSESWQAQCGGDNKESTTTQICGPSNAAVDLIHFFNHLQQENYFFSTYSYVGICPPSYNPNFNINWPQEINSQNPNSSNLTCHYVHNSTIVLFSPPNNYFHGFTANLAQSFNTSGYIYFAPFAGGYEIFDSNGNSCKFTNPSFRSSTNPDQNYNFGFGSSNASITVTGIPTNFQWTNGHLEFDVTVNTANGPISGRFSMKLDCFNLVECYNVVNNATCGIGPGDPVNPYVHGILGNWRPLKTYAYNKNRDYAPLINGNTQFNLRTDGHINDPDNSGAFKPFYKLNPNGTWSIDPSSWTYASEITKTTPWSNEVENKDALNRFSSAIFGYRNTLATAVASNARYRQIAFDGFEDYRQNELDNCSTPHFNFYDFKNKLSSNESHTGVYSIKVELTDDVFVERPVTPSWSLGVEGGISNGKYLMKECDCLGVFSPSCDSNSDRKYIISYWVKETSSNNNARIDVSVNYSSITLSAIKKTKEIEGWVRHEREFTIPSHSTGGNVKFQIKVDNGFAYFDDIRIHPFNSGFKSYVYHPYSLKLMAELDDNNFATLYEYDEEGLLVRLKKETDRGIMTLKESRNYINKN